jgi:heme-degrading monooxygenase HmoA
MMNVIEPMKRFEQPTDMRVETNLGKITVLRRWFVPSDKLEEFKTRWLFEIMPAIRRQPGCLSVEAYRSSVRDHWVTAISWESEECRLRAFERLSPIYNDFAAYERFEPEILTLFSQMT